MNQHYASGALKQYQQIDVQASVTEASPHALIHLLLRGGLERISKAKGHIRCGDAQKCILIGQTISILDGLRNALNMSVGGEIAQNLDNLYEYCQRRLFNANISNDTTALDEVSSLLREIMGAWEAISPEDSQNPSVANEHSCEHPQA